jgi:hypothetical protein
VHVLQLSPQKLDLYLLPHGVDAEIPRTLSRTGSLSLPRGVPGFPLSFLDRLKFPPMGIAFSLPLRTGIAIGLSLTRLVSLTLRRAGVNLASISPSVG